VENVTVPLEVFVQSFVIMELRHSMELVAVAVGLLKEIGVLMEVHLILKLVGIINSLANGHAGTAGTKEHSRVILIQVVIAVALKDLI
jgi:hypothetical protein